MRFRQLLKTWREKRRRAAVESHRSTAKMLLLVRLEDLLVRGYEKDPSLRMRGPSGSMMLPNYTNQFEWFAATEYLLVEEFIRSVQICESEAEARELIARCNDIVTKWCLKHSANREVIVQCEQILREGVSKFRPAFDYQGLIPSVMNEFKQWINRQPGLEANYSMIVMYLAEDGVLSEWIRYGSEPLFSIGHEAQNRDTSGADGNKRRSV